MRSAQTREEKMTLGDKLKAERDKAGMSQEALARKSDLSVSAVRDYEQGKKEPSLRNAVKIADALGVSVEVFADSVRGELPARYVKRAGRRRMRPAEQAGGRGGRDRASATPG
jgi:transcriptional regulator with XRE-family HTH domain